MVRCYGETFELPFTITNCCNNYGPYQFPEKVVRGSSRSPLDDQPLTLYASQENRREWVHVIDHCRAIDAVLQSGRVGETYHVGSGKEASVTEIADTVLNETGRPLTLKTIVPDRPGHDRRYLLDSSKIRRELGWAPQVEFATGLHETVAWYMANEAWWRPLIGRSPGRRGDARQYRVELVRVLVTGAGGPGRC